MGFAHVGENVQLSKNISVIGVENISLGNNVRVDGYTTIAAFTGSLEIGDFVHIGGGSYLGCSGGIVMESFSALSHGVKLFSSSDDYTGVGMTNPTVPSKYTNRTTGLIQLRRHSVIGANSVVLPDLVVGEGCAVGALSLVSKSLPEWSICQGNPAEFVRSRLKLLLKKEARLIQDLG